MSWYVLVLLYSSDLLFASTNLINSFSIEICEYDTVLICLHCIASCVIKQLQFWYSMNIPSKIYRLNWEQILSKFFKVMSVLLMYWKQLTMRVVSYPFLAWLWKFMWVIVYHFLFSMVTLVPSWTIVCALSSCSLVSLRLGLCNAPLSYSFTIFLSVWSFVMHILSLNTACSFLYPCLDMLTAVVFIFHYPACVPSHHNNTCSSVYSSRFRCSFRSASRLYFLGSKFPHE